MLKMFIRIYIYINIYIYIYIYMAMSHLLSVHGSKNTVFMGKICQNHRFSCIKLIKVKNTCFFKTFLKHVKNRVKTRFQPCWRHDFWSIYSHKKDQVKITIRILKILFENVFLAFLEICIFKLKPLFCTCVLPQALFYLKSLLLYLRAAAGVFLFKIALLAKSYIF